MSLAKETNETFLNVMQMGAMQVLTMCSYLKEKVDIVKLRYGNSNGGAS